MKDKKLIEEKDLDKLLNSLFLEENSMEVNENSARFILEQEYDVKIDAGKEKELLSRLKAKPNGSGGYWNFLIIILVAVLGGIGILFFYKHNPSINNNSQKHLGKSDKNKHGENAGDIPGELPVPSMALSKTQDSSLSDLKIPFISGKIKEELHPDFSLRDIPVYFPQSDVKGNRSSLKLFEPTEQEFAFYSMVKNKMLEKLLSIDKGSYTVVEEGEIQYRGKAIVVDPFILRNQAITNLEYKVFLADLIKNGKTEEFKKAVVLSETWINYNDNILANSYFPDEKYNDFPVVNISPEGAFLFCRWMEKEINQFAQSINPKAKPLKIRLPFDSEWIFATRRGYAQIPDCGSYNTIYDINEGIIDIGYLKRIELIKKRKKSKMTALDQLFSTNRYGMDEDQTLQIFEQGFNYKGKPITDTLYPNRMDIFSKAAHVSEIIQEQGTGNIVIVGSCWKNKQEYSKMITEFNKEFASPFVGFRVVIINDNKASYKDPFW